VVNYVLAQYGRAGGAVLPAYVAVIRQGGPSSPLVLLARIGIAGGGVAVLVIVLTLGFYVMRRRRAGTSATS
jgi:hypothetical protein